MSVTEVNKIDGMGKGKDGNQLLFLIADHLDWSDEQTHLLQLQEKINAYLMFIESKQFQTTYPDDDFDSYIIEFHFKHEPTSNCMKFLDVVARQVAEIHVEIKVEIV